MLNAHLKCDIFIETHSIRTAKMLDCGLTGSMGKLGNVGSMFPDAAPASRSFFASASVGSASKSRSGISGIGGPRES